MKNAPRKPDFEQFLKVTRREAPDRPTLFEFFMNEALDRRLAGDTAGVLPPDVARIRAFGRAGYDYATVGFPRLFDFHEPERGASYSANDTVTIAGWADFEAYRWREPDPAEYRRRLERLSRELRPGMKFIGSGPGGLLENLILLLGFENLCLLLADDPELVRAVADRIGATLLRHYEMMLESEFIGAGIVNDDWGFHSQPMLPPETMRELILPWHRKMVGVLHAAGRPALLHSCGNLASLMDDIIDDLRFDGKHSFEDNIQPVEEAYEAYGSRIAILGGIDLDFLCRSTPEAIRARALAMLERTAGRGGYALGSGNSIPYYVPPENYLAMINAAGVGARLD